MAKYEIIAFRMSKQIDAAAVLPDLSDETCYLIPEITFQQQ